MTITINAVYEGGVLKPAQPLPLSEHSQVRVTVEPQARTDDPSERAAATQPARTSVPAVEKIIARAEALPADVVTSWPIDGASQHDHYLYGKPKRPE
jgi:predicted DNA-binding antitoxin AbrB/MazE fold protein